MTNLLRFLPLAILFGFTSCCSEAPTEVPPDAAAAISGAEVARLPEVRYYVIADT
jgi:hypothetical protein